jgi:hypothetical protein
MTHKAEQAGASMIGCRATKTRRYRELKGGESDLLPPLLKFDHAGPYHF